MASQFSFWWQKFQQKIRRHPARSVVIIGATIVGGILFVVILGGYLFNWDWTGFNGGVSNIIITNTSKGITITEEMYSTRKLWDWLGLLATFAIPVVVGFGVAWFSVQQGKVSNAENKDNQREAALQEYFDKMSELLLEKRLRESTEDAEVRKIAYVRTLTVLPRLDPTRKRSVLHFLFRAGLISISKPIVNLDGADFSKADLSDADLEGTNLGGIDLLDSSTGNPNNLSPLETYLTNVSQLSGTALNIVRLNGVNLSKAYLVRTNLKGTHLFGANLNDASLCEANLNDAFLIGASLQKADLTGTYFYRANLTGANLKDAVGITPKELEKQARSLKGATMPDGSIHP